MIATERKRTGRREERRNRAKTKLMWEIFQNRFKAYLGILYINSHIKFNVS